MLLWELCEEPHPLCLPSRAPRVPESLPRSSSGPVLPRRPRLHPMASCFREQLTRGRGTADGGNLRILPGRYEGATFLSSGDPDPLQNSISKNLAESLDQKNRKFNSCLFCCCSVAKSHLTLCDPPWTASLLCPTLSPRDSSNSCPLSQ